MHFQSELIKRVSEWKGKISRQTLSSAWAFVDYKCLKNSERVTQSFKFWNHNINIYNNYRYLIQKWMKEEELTNLDLEKPSFFYLKCGTYNFTFNIVWSKLFMRPPMKHRSNLATIWNCIKICKVLYGSFPSIQPDRIQPYIKMGFDYRILKAFQFKEPGSFQVLSCSFFLSYLLLVK
jgi:hypothetical protein